MNVEAGQRGHYTAGWSPVGPQQAQPHLDFEGGAEAGKEVPIDILSTNTTPTFVLYIVVYLSMGQAGSQTLEERETLLVQPPKAREWSKGYEVFSKIAAATYKPLKREWAANSWIRPGTKTLIDRRWSMLEQGILGWQRGGSLGERSSSHFSWTGSSGRIERGRQQCYCWLGRRRRSHGGRCGGRGGTGRP